MYITNTYKEWVRFLKDKKVYGRYIRDINAVNNYLGKTRYNNSLYYWDLWESGIMTLSGPVFKQPRYKDEFADRFTCIRPSDLAYHLNRLKLYCQDFGWLRILGEFQEKKRTRELSAKLSRKINRRNNKDCRHYRGVKEENEEPWYNCYYKSNKQVWGR